ncbi:response regulator [Nitrosomonas marina]|nr:response regulator [Nitrosomonas marina]
MKFLHGIDMLSIHTKFLIVDDIANKQIQIKPILKDMGFLNVDEANGGQIALQKLLSDDFDFIISSWYMSAMDGLTVLRKIRAVEKLNKVPVLMVAAEIKKKDILDAVQAGADGILTRPFTATVLSEKLGLIARNHINQVS